MKLIVGLGNPGAKYARHRHNVGYLAAERIAARFGLGPWRRRFQGEAAEGEIEGVRCLVLKPETFMNESGRAAAEAMRFFKLAPDDVIALHDELDLAPGKLKVKLGGGNAGHNGLRSLSAHLGNEYQRVRIGIGHPGHKDAVHGYVLHDFAKADQEWLESLLDAVAEAMPQLVAGEPARFMSELARLTRPEEDRKPPRPAKPAKPKHAAEARSLEATPAEADLDPPRPAESPLASPQPARSATSAGGLADSLRKWLRQRTDKT